MKHTAYIGIGSNLGNRGMNIRDATARLSDNSMIAVTKSSNIYDTEPLLKNSSNGQPRYLNTAIEIQTSLDPETLLSVLMEIERYLGRPHPRKSGEPRTIDLDILLFDDLVLDTQNLKIPHPEIEKRLFVLEPLCDIAPTLSHPRSGRSFEEIKNALKRDG